MSAFRMPFSARNRSTAQLESVFPDTARNGLLHILHDGIRREVIAGWMEVARELSRAAKEAPISYPRTIGAQEHAEQLVGDMSWDRLFDFCERLYSRLPVEQWYRDEDGNKVITKTIDEARAFIEEELRQLFAEEHLAVDFVDGLVQRRGRKHTTTQIERASVVLDDKRLESARTHFQKALRFFRTVKEPDFENAVKEAVCAVEAAGRTLFPEARAKTLGELAAWLVKGRLPRLPPALGQTLTGLYAFRGSGDGVAHGGAKGGKASSAVAEYALSVCASQIVLLVDLAGDEDVPF